MTDEIIIEVKNLKTRLDHKWVHHDINFSVKRGEIFVIIGGSGAGKTVLMRELLTLKKPTAGEIHIFSKELTKASSKTLLSIQRRWGVLFQQNALFSSLTLLENVAFPLKEHTQLDENTIRELALLKIAMAGLPMQAANNYPSELSGGMQKRAALARAIVLDPELLFLDEPTTGLDPSRVAAFDELIVNLQKTTGITIVMITHDVESLKRVANRVAFLGEGKVLCEGTVDEVMQNPHPMIQEFFNESQAE